MGLLRRCSAGRPELAGALAADDLDNKEGDDRNSDSAAPTEHRGSCEADRKRRKQTHERGHGRALGERTCGRLALVYPDEGVDSDHEQIPEEAGNEREEQGSGYLHAGQDVEQDRNGGTD